VAPWKVDQGSAQTFGERGRGALGELVRTSIRAPMPTLVRDAVIIEA
jgi:hypothetical protein